MGTTAPAPSADTERKRKNMNAFEHFGPEHTLTLLFIMAAVSAGLVLSRNLSDVKAVALARILSFAALFGETLQDLLLIRDGGDIMGFLPLHLCNLGIFVNLAASFSHGKVRRFFSEISLLLIMPGAAGALLFPDWNYRPFWSYLPILCFLTHSLTVFIPLLLLVKKKVSVSASHFWYHMLFLLIVTPPVYFLDRMAGTNYMFLNFPPEGSPLQWIYGITGDKFYLLGLSVLVILILIAEYAVCFLARKIFSRR